MVHNDALGHRVKTCPFTPGGHGLLVDVTEAGCKLVDVAEAGWRQQSSLLGAWVTYPAESSINLTTFSVIDFFLC